MSRNTLERVLWQLSVERAAKQKFREAPREFLSRFALSEDEVEMVVGFDVAGLQQPQDAGKVGAGGKRLLRLPDHRAAEIALGDGDRLLHAFQHGAQGDIFVQKAPASTVGDLAQELETLYEGLVDRRYSHSPALAQLLHSSHAELGLLLEQLQQWRQACEQANGGAGPVHEQGRVISADTQQQLRNLERELQRKTEALAEAAALLVLRKKADAIWGKDEDV